MIRRALLLAITLLVALAAPAFAQSYTEGVTTDRASVTPGGQLGVSACCFPPGSTVTFSVGGAVLGIGIANADGVASGTFTVPSNVAAGAATVTASATAPDGTVITQTGALEVGSTSATTAMISGLPVTGSSSSLPLTALAAALVAVGGLAVLAGRRHHEESSGPR